MAAKLAAAIFDMDGVVTRTAEPHAEAWKAVFDEALRAWATAHGVPFRPFDEVSDYLSYVDGRPRQDGVRNFLSARGIELPEGTAGDEPSLATVQAWLASTTSFGRDIYFFRVFSPLRWSTFSEPGAVGAGSLLLRVSSLSSSSSARRRRRSAA